MEPSFWQNFRAWLRTDKTRFDIIDRLRALLMLAGIMLLLELVLDIYYQSN